MAVIPFDPSKRRARYASTHAPRDGEAEAEARIALLERALISTLRENAQNWARAEHAEARLAEFETVVSDGIADRTAPPLHTGA